MKIKENERDRATIKLSYTSVFFLVENSRKYPFLLKKCRNLWIDTQKQNHDEFLKRDGNGTSQT